MATFELRPEEPPQRWQFYAPQPQATERDLLNAMAARLDDDAPRLEYACRLDCCGFPCLAALVRRTPTRDLMRLLPSLFGVGLPAPGESMLLQWDAAAGCWCVVALDMPSLMADLVARRGGSRPGSSDGCLKVFLYDTASGRWSHRDEPLPPLIGADELAATAALVNVRPDVVIEPGG